MVTAKLPPLDSHPRGGASKKTSGAQEHRRRHAHCPGRRGFLVQLAMDVFLRVNLLVAVNVLKMDKLPIGHFS